MQGKKNKHGLYLQKAENILVLNSVSKLTKNLPTGKTNC